ncbi:hypothetical protein J437_LFUL017198 [Ladona fulva]|uniref:CUB domain-containing protein n=1 Tax=Ladona fulva TaxID=123851 RepID=A0A8K0KSC2_LADFU|nr:hypothetical protein J437_LFUL017198 [Ladona fulva]
MYSIKEGSLWIASIPRTDWFPGWASHGHYNRQPNDDGLSGQDCVELRRAYQLPAAPPPASYAHRLPKFPPRTRSTWPTPPLRKPLGEGVPPNRLSATYAWNDRDCSAGNYYVCEREVPSLSGGGTKGKGIGGGRESQSPGAEEEDAGGDEEGEDTSPGIGGRNHNCNRKIRLGGVEKKVSSRAEEGKGSSEVAEVLIASSSTAIVTSPNFPAPYPDDVHCDTLVTAPSGFRLLLEFEELVLEDEPT